ncbi:hypothetical protein AAF712_016592, partial [Marasmius tenuissimus]
MERVYLYWNTKHIPGPSFAISGNFQESLDDEDAVVVGRWMNKYGNVLRLWGFFGQVGLMVADLKAVAHVLKNDAAGYQKPDLMVYFLGRLTGRGLLTVDGEQHRKQ